MVATTPPPPNDPVVRDDRIVHDTALRDDRLHDDRLHDDHRHDRVRHSVSPAPGLLDRVSWGAILAGTVIALATLVLLGMMGSAIGFSAIDPGTGAPFEGVGIGAGIWWVLTSIISLAIGGFVAGRLSGIPDKSAATAHGATVWGLVTLLSLYMAASAVGTLFNTATGALSTATQAVGTAVGTAGDAVLTPNGPVDVSQAEIREAGQDVVAEARQAAQQVDTQELRQDATRVADNALGGLSDAAWAAFFASLLSLAAAVVAAGAGAPRHAYIEGRERDRT